jgi:hypothetical protein
MLDSHSEPLTRHERPWAVPRGEAGHERPDIAFGLQPPGQAPQRVARLDDVGGR